MPINGSIKSASFPIIVNLTAVKLTIMGNEADFILPFIGMFQVHNVLCAAGIAIGCGANPTDVIRYLSSLQSAPGRMQLVGTVSGGSVYVDYAHTPDALTQVLTAFRAHTRGLEYGHGRL